MTRVPTALWAPSPAYSGFEEGFPEEGFPKEGSGLLASLAKLYPPWNQERGGQMKCGQVTRGDSSGWEGRLPSGLCP